MTTTIATEVKRRRSQSRSRRERLTFGGDLAMLLGKQITRQTRIVFPSDRYRDDPVAFFREIIGVDPWSRQREIMEAIRDHPRVAIKSGHKVSKSHTAAGVALWWYCSYEDARVVMSSTTSRQVDQILWRELGIMRARSGKCVECKKSDPKGRLPVPCEHSGIIEGEIGKLARTGLKSEDYREIVGFTAREAEAVAGISGANLLYILDEASGIPAFIFEAIEGNRAGGARAVLFGNPTKTHGEFFDAFHSKSKHYHTITVSSEETPNVAQGRRVIPGLATREWIEEKKEEWGEDSALYKVRVKGEFPVGEDGKIFSIEAITQAEERWGTTEPDEKESLYIGVDPAGEQGTGDPSAFVVRRGHKVIEIVTQQGLSTEAHINTVKGLIATHANPREKPVVVLDREGAVGAKVYGFFSAYVSGRNPPFDLVPLRASDRAHRDPMIYDRMRDELCANLLTWINEGGAIPPDVKLQAEMHEFEWIQQESTGRLKVTPKKVIRKTLGRSPDRFDALTLACWVPSRLRRDRAASGTGLRRDDFGDHGGGSDFIDPY